MIDIFITLRRVKIFSKLNCLKLLLILSYLIVKEFGHSVKKDINLDCN